MSTGIAALDEMLGDGYLAGRRDLVAGPSGTGKTLMGLHFIFNGARTASRGVIATFQENPTQLERIAKRSAGRSTTSAVELMYRSPVDVYIDEWVYDLLDAVERDRRPPGADRQPLRPAVRVRRDEIRFREYMYSLSQRLARQGVSLFMTSELPDLFHVTRLSEFGVSHLSDNVVLLQYVRDSTAIRRALTVLKTRASHHHPEIREFTITADGIVLGAPPDQLQ